MKPEHNKRTAKEWQHFQAIAAAEKEADERRYDEAAASTPGERLLAGIRLSMQAPWSRLHLAELDAQTDGQMELARRRVALNLSAKRP